VVVSAVLVCWKYVDASEILSGCGRSPRVSQWIGSYICGGTETLKGESRLDAEEI
jgi:hypothetical protein